MKKSIMPYILNCISSNQLRDAKRKFSVSKRTVLRKQPTLVVFLKADDPYSYLLVQALKGFDSRFKVSLQYHVFQNVDPEMYPRLDMWREYAKHDAYCLANLYGYRFPEKGHIPIHNEQSANQLALSLATIESDDDFLIKANKLFAQYWFSADVLGTSVGDAKQAQLKLMKNQLLLSKKGHYFGATIYYEGEWYWGIDRLDHLEQRLIELSLSVKKDEHVFFNKTYEGFCQTPISSIHQASKKKSLTLYWSARSPYSYIGLERSVQLAKHYNLPLEIKPVLPMMMRGMNVPDTKKMYIFLDTKREANKFAIPYGKVADPLGAAVERCYALVEYARSQNKLHDFLLSFARGVNAEGIRAETDRGMKKIVSRCGLDWATAKLKLNDQSWRDEVHKNLDDMLAAGCWGVPSICYHNMHFWGQDRLGLIEKYIREELR